MHHARSLINAMRLTAGCGSLEQPTMSRRVHMHRVAEPGAQLPGMLQPDKGMRRLGRTTQGLQRSHMSNNPCTPEG